MVDSIGGNAVQASRIPLREASKDAARNLAHEASLAALEKLRRPRQRTEAEGKLEEILQAMKSASKSSKVDAARRKLEQLKARIKALQLAAAAAAARGDPKAAKALAREIKQIARDLSTAIRDAGQGNGGAGLVLPDAAPAKDQAASADKAGQVVAAVGGTLTEGRAPQAADEAAAAIKGAIIGKADDPLVAGAREDASLKQALEAIKAEARDLVKQLKKLLQQARIALLNPDGSKEERAKAEKAFAEAEQAVGELEAASLSSGGGTVGGGAIDLQA